MKFIKYILLITALSILTACGSSSDTPVSTNKTMKLTVVLEGSDAALVKGIQGTIVLPAGVIPKADATGKITGMTKAANTPSGEISGTYKAATEVMRASVTLVFATTENFTAGDILILEADLASGVSAPAAAAFSISESTLKNGDGATIPTSGAWLTLR